MILNAAPRLFRRGRGVALGVLGLISSGITTLAGCSPAPAPPLVTRPGSDTSSTSSGQSAQNTDGSGSLNAALAKIDAPTVQAWFNRWSAPLGGPSAARVPEVRIDVETLARRHPSWQLADALERGALSPAAPQIAPLLANLTAPSFLTPPAALNAILPVRPATILRQNASNQAALGRQNAALERFFASAAARDALRGRDEAFLSRRALENSIAASRRGAVSELDLSLIPPDVALELTNLRLQLLRNLAKTPAQREAARAEIAAIEARYAQIWREQTALQAARVRQMTVDAPARVQREGLANIARTSQSATQTRAAARREVARGLQGRLSRDVARIGDDLTLPLPAARIVPSVGSSAKAAKRSATQFFETPLAPLSSASLSSARALDAKPLALPCRFDAALVTQLRRQARDDARSWARLVAAGWGSRWSKAVSAPNRTGAAVQQLFSAPRRRASQPGTS